MNILDFFPIPSYLKMPAVGLDISDQSLKYIEFRKKRKNMELLKYGRKTIPQGIIESGLIKKPEELIHFLFDFRKEIRNNRIIAALPEEKTFIGDLELPYMEKEEIQESLSLQIEENIPLKAEEAVFEYEIDEKIIDDKKHIDVSFAAVPVEIAKSYRDALIKAGFYPVAFETEPHALSRALIKPNENDPQIIIDFGKTRTSFIIVNGRKVELSGTIKAGGETIDAEISRKFSVDAKEAKHLKHQADLSRTNEKISGAILPIISSIKDEAAKHLSFWKTRPPRHNAEERKEIKNIILCGGDSNLTGLPEYLSRTLDLKTELANPWTNISFDKNYIPEIELKESLIYAAAIGLALRQI